MNSKAMSVSLFMAGLAVYFVMTSVSSIEDEAKTKFGTDVTILVAKTDIKEMDTILETSIEPLVVPKRFVEPSDIAFNSVVDAKSEDFAIETKRIVGNVAVVSIKKGEHLSLNKITEPNMRTGLAPQVTPGRRAIALGVDETNSVSKLMKPGDRVDVIAVVDSGGNKVAKTILQDVVVLAVGRNITNNIARKLDVDASTGHAKARSLAEFDGYSSVTIEVDQAQAQLLAVISSTNGSKLIFTLRNNDDTDRNNMGVARVTDALTDSARQPAGGGRQ